MNHACRRKAAWEFIKAPCCRLSIKSVLAAGHGCTLYIIGIFDSLFLRLQISIITGVIISAPIWLHQLWTFIAPGLYARERRWAYCFVGDSVPLFATGGTIAYSR